MRELFLTDPDQLHHVDRFKPGKPLQNAFILFDRLLKVVDRFMPKWVRQPALLPGREMDARPLSGQGRDRRDLSCDGERGRGDALPRCVGA